MNILIKFRHGLGDAAQLTLVLTHLRHAHPDWNIDVAALPGKHSAFHGLCRNVFLLPGQELPPAQYDRIFSLDWPECATCYANWPSTKAERCLQEVFQIEPAGERCRYTILPSQEAVDLARRYLEQVCMVHPNADGRYPVVLIHYEGNTSGRDKNLSHAVAGRLCDTILECGAVPVILDWDDRSPLPDGRRIHNPHADLELWQGLGTGDAGALAALMEMATLVVGVDSGPLHVAGATSTPTIGVWTHHHPLHYFSHADHVIHLVPQNHPRLLRGDRDLGQRYFDEHYRSRIYDNLESELAGAVRDRLAQADGGLVFTRGFWVRSNNSAQDLVVVSDIAEHDAYRIAQMPMPRPVVVDVGAHIGVFSREIHRRNPLAQIIAVECCPENFSVLRRNIGDFATVVEAAMTYEPEVALMNAVYPGCRSTGGSTVVARRDMHEKLAANQINCEATDACEYWADLRPLITVTLEQLMERHNLDHIDILKLDCEGSEFSILRNTTVLDRIGLIVGEYHGKTEFLRLVEQRFQGWKLQLLSDGDLGNFWLTRA